MKRAMRVLAAVLSALLLFCGCNKEPLTMLRYDLSSRPDTLDPQYCLSDTSATIIENCFEGLTRISASGQVMPACAESWKQQGLTYIFTLREGLKWADGSEITAADFVFALKRMFNNGGSASAENYKMIKNAGKILDGQLPPELLGVRAVDERTLEIELDYEDSSILKLLSQSAAMPCQEEFFIGQKGRYGLDAKTTLCNGPFYIESWSDSSVLLKRNENYRNPPNIEEVRLYFNRGDAIELFKEGRSDLVLVPFQHMGEAQGLHGEVFYEQSWVLIYNTERPLLSQRQARQAMTSVIDITKLYERLPQSLLAGGGVIAPEAMIGGVRYRDMVGEPSLPRAEENPRELLQQAMSAAGIERQPGLTLLVSSFSPGPELGGAMMRDWQQKLSIFVNMEQLDYTELLTRASARDFDIALMPLIADGSSPVDFLSQFESVELDNGSETVTMGDLINTARRYEQPERAAEALFAAEQRLVEEYVALPMFDAPTLFAYIDDIEGVSYSSTTRTIYFGDVVVKKDD